MPATRLMIAISPTAGGGLERTTLTLLSGFDRSVVRPSVVLTHAQVDNSGFVSSLPSDVDVFELGKRGFVDQRRAINVLRSLYERQRPDVVMGRGTYANVIALLARRGARHKPAVIATEHATPALLRRPRTIWLQWVGRRLYRGAEAVLTVSDGMRSAVARAFNVDQAGIRFIHNGYPAEMDALLTDQGDDALGLPFGSGAPVILFVGRLTSEKGADDLVRAVALLSPDLAARLLMVGDGPLLEPLGDLARELGVAERIRFAGYRPYPWREMAEADVVVAPSRSEAFSVMLLEATRAGAAIVATDCDWGPREVLTDEHDGLLVPVGSPQALATAIRRVLEEPGLADRLRVAARATSERFTPERMVRAHETLILELAGRQASR